MIALGQAALVAAVALGIGLFRFYPGHRLVIGVYVAGVLFLPEFGATEYVEGVPPPLTVAGVQLAKPNAIALGLLVGSLVFDRRRWVAGRLRWFDLPVLAWCAGPLVTAVVNARVYGDSVAGYVAVSTDFPGSLVSWLVASDVYDGTMRALDAALSWGVPYCLGRLYLTDARKLTEAVLWVVAGAAAYAPLCLLEAAVSPQLHRWVYGFHQHDFLQSIRLGGYRPMVFLEHGLAVGLWMTVGALAAAWLWLAGPLRQVLYFRGRVGGLWLVLPLIFVAVACRSTGALVLGALGMVVLALARLARGPLPVLALLCVPPLYVAARVTRTWDAHQVLGVMHVAGEARVQSLEFRLQNEEMLLDKALERPAVGWGGWGRSRVYDESGQPVTVADGLWIFTLGERGLFGLFTLGFMMLLPPARVALLQGSRPWTRPDSAAAGAASVVLALYAMDCLLNGMLNPVFLLLAGGLIALPANESGPTARDPPRTTPAWRVRPARPHSRITPHRPRWRIATLPGSRLHTRRNADGRPPPPEMRVPPPSGD